MATDLCDMQALSRVNQGNRYILTVIDILSKYAWALPVKSKSAKDISVAFERLFSDNCSDSIGHIVENEENNEKQKHVRVPKRLQTDKGKEFLNREAQAVFARHKVEHFTTLSDKKAAIVERFNRTLKSRIWQYFSYHQTEKYIDVPRRL